MKLPLSDVWAALRSPFVDKLSAPSPTIRFRSQRMEQAAWLPSGAACAQLHIREYFAEQEES